MEKKKFYMYYSSMLSHDLAPGDPILVNLAPKYVQDFFFFKVMERSIVIYAAVMTQWKILYGD